jgi:hypothetical protein
MNSLGGRAFYRLKAGAHLKGLEPGRCYEALKLPRHEVKQGIVRLVDEEGTPVGEYPLFFLEPCPEPEGPDDIADVTSAW